MALNFKVTDVPAAVDRLVAGGAVVEVAPTKGLHEIRATLRDRGGHTINLFSPMSK